MPDSFPRDPVPVEVTSPTPLPVEVVNVPVTGTQDQRVDPSVLAKTTFQEDLTFAGQRQINLIWERTQAVIAILVVLANMIVGTFQGIWGAMLEYPIILSSSLFLVVGFYFSRTNHAAIGGVGQKPNGEYTGR